MNQALWILFLHFIGDFVLQTDWMAKNKSKRDDVLWLHVGTYGCLLFIFLGFRFAVISAVLHFFVDRWTSRWTSALWEKKEVHWFFVVIGFDQFIHAVCLLKLWEWTR